MLFKYICICLLFVIIKADQTARQRFEQFKLRYNKNYEHVCEEQMGFEKFSKNLNIIMTHNRNYHLGLSTYALAINEYADWSAQEFHTFMFGSSETKGVSGLHTATFSTATINMQTLPDFVDWRIRGAVTPVKKQLKCGSCWAFAATGALEGQHFLKTGELISLSEQNLLDCTLGEPYNNRGCQGGSKERSWIYVSDNNGINTETAYPYQAKLSPSCNFNYTDIGTTASGFIRIPRNDEAALLAAVATVGPVAVAVNSLCPQTQFYSSGIFNDPKCPQKPINHAMLIVGYGTDYDSQTDYWILKNSWGSQWGMNGYMMMPRNVNFAGIARRASYPLV